jgi:hypothetical protein
VNPGGAARPAVPGAAPLLSSTWLLIRLRLRRLANQLDALSMRKKAGAARRTGNPGKKSSKVIMYLAWPLMLFVFGAIAVQSLINLHLAIDPPDTFWRTLEFSDGLVVGAAFLLLLLFTSSLLVNIASGELAKSEWDLASPGSRGCAGWRRWSRCSRPGRCCSSAPSYARCWTRVCGCRCVRRSCATCTPFCR